MFVPATFSQRPSSTLETIQEYLAPVWFSAASTSPQVLIVGVSVATVILLTIVWSLMCSLISSRAPNELVTFSVALPAPISNESSVYGRSHHSESMIVVTGLTMSGAASVETLCVPIGQSEFSMSMTCWARTPCGLFRPMRIPSAAVVAGASAQLVAVVAAVTIATAIVSARRLALVAGPGNVQHNLELKELSPGRHRVGPFAGMGGDGRAAGPGLEGVLGLPLRHDKVAVLALDRPQQLESEESGLVVDGMRAVGEPSLQLRACAGRYLDCVDLDHGHGAKATGRMGW